MKNKTLHIVLAGALIGAGLMVPPLARAHCDTMDGPVVVAAQAALKNKDLTPVLKWVKKEAEAEIKAAFARTLAVRSQSAAARELADQFFFETLVRVHRAGEGAPYTGLKPAGTKIEPAIAAADQAIASGAVEKVIQLVTEDAAAGIRKRFAEVREKQEHAAHNVEAGRAWVAAYVDYVHYVEALHQAAQAAGAHHSGGQEAALPEHAHHQPAPQHNH